MNDRDHDRLTLLDRLAERLPWLDLDQQSIEWTTLDDDHDALLVTGGGIDGGHKAPSSPTRATMSCRREFGPAPRGLCRLHRHQTGWQPHPRSGRCPTRWRGRSRIGADRVLERLAFVAPMKVARTPALRTRGGTASR
jgi:hypothetical protein